MRIIALILTVLIVACAANPQPASTPQITDEQILLIENFKKEQALIISKHVQEQAEEIWQSTPENATEAEKEAIVEGELEELLAWLAAESMEALNVGDDLEELLAAARVVFSAACDHDKVVYEKAWGSFLAIILKYAGSIACDVYFPGAGSVCLVVGHILGKGLGTLVGGLIHDSSCGPRLMHRQEIEDYIYNWHYVK